jgi:hypothetical protein
VITKEQRGGEILNWFNVSGVGHSWAGLVLEKGNLYKEHWRDKQQKPI